MSYYHDQYRIQGLIYLFQTRSDESITLKIYNSQNLLFKTCLEVPSGEVSTLFENRQIIVLFKSINSSFFPFSIPELSIPIPFTNTNERAPQLDLFKIVDPALLPHTLDPLEIISSELEPLLRSLKLRIPIGDMEESLTCPITLDILRDPVIDDCGHTFSKSAIEEHLKNSKSCPIGRKPITKLIPNRKIQEIITERERLSQNPIPTFHLFNSPDPNLAKSYLDIAVQHSEQKSYPKALKAYEEALQYTNQWQDYQAIPSLFQKMGEPQKATLATLYLVKYQLDAGEVEKAVQNLETLKPEDKAVQGSINFILAMLYTERQDLSKALPLALIIAEECEKSNPEKAIILYNHVLRHQPTNGKAYKALIKLLPNQEEKLYLQAMCHAIQSKQDKTAQLCYEKIFQNNRPALFVDVLAGFPLFGRDVSLIETSLIKMAAFYEVEGNFKEALKAYRYLITLKDPKPFWYQKIIQIQSKLQKSQKAIQWAIEWLDGGMKCQAYPLVEAVAEEALKIISSDTSLNSIPLYERVAFCYTEMGHPKLQEILKKLAQIYQSQKKLDLAEKTYLQRFEKFPSLSTGIDFAKILEEANKISYAVKIYYLSTTYATFEPEERPLFVQVLGAIDRLDPKLQHLTIAQRVQLRTVKRLNQLENEVGEQKVQIETLCKALEQTQKKLIEVQEQLTLQTHPLRKSEGKLETINNEDHEQTKLKTLTHTPIELDERNVQLYLEAINIQINLHGENHEEIARGYLKIGDFYWSNRYHNAIDYYKKALQVFLHLYGEKHLDAAQCYYKIGQAVYIRGFGLDGSLEALSWFQKVVKVWLVLHGEHHKGLVEVYLVIASLKALHKETSEAVRYYQKSRSLLLHLYEEHEKEIKGSYESFRRLGSIREEVYLVTAESFQLCNDHQEALLYYQKNHSLLLHRYGEKHQEISKSYGRLNEAFLKLGRTKEAAECLRKKQEIEKLLEKKIEKLFEKEKENKTFKNLFDDL